MSDNLTSMVSLFLDSSHNVAYNFLGPLISNYVPLKYINHVKYFPNTKLYIKSRLENMKSFLLLKSYDLQLKFFSKKIFFIRFLNHFLLGIFSTSFLAKLVVNKVNDFIKSNIKFFFETSQIFRPNENNLYFLGFSIKLSQYSDKKLISFNLGENNNFTSKIKARIQLRKLKISNVLKSRISSELISHIIRIMYLKKLKFNFFKQRFLWIYIFQLESMRSIQINSLLELGKRKILLSDECGLFPQILREIRIWEGGM